jgi:hypothetical protein
LNEEVEDMRRMIFLALLLVFSTLAFATQRLPESLNISSQRRISLDRDWRFLKADAPGAEQPNVGRLGVADGSFAARLRHRGTVQQAREPAGGCSARVRHRLVPETFRAARVGEGPLFHRRV